MPRRDEYPAPPEAVPNVGLPLTHASLHHVLVEPGPDEDRAKPEIRDWEARCLDIIKTTEYGRRDYGPEDHKWFKADERWIYIDFEVLAERFTLDEMCRAKWKSFIMSEVSERFGKDPLYLPLYKVPNSMWQCGGLSRSKSDYGAFVRLYRGLARFDFGVDGFTSYFDHTDYECGATGHARYGRFPVTCKNGETYLSRQWLDGVFAYNIVHKGAVVLTVGFSLADTGVLVSQIQVRGKKKGNRWLYKLPTGLREHVIDRLRAAWSGVPVRLVTGASQKKYNQWCYRRNPADYPDAVADRVAAFYDAPLAGYGFGDAVSSAPGWGPPQEFRELVPATGVPADRPKSKLRKLRDLVCA